MKRRQVQQDKKQKQQVKADPGNESIEETWEEIEKIKRDNQSLQEEIVTEIRQNNQTQPNIEGQFENVQIQSSNYAKQIEHESKKYQNLKALIQITEESIKSMREAMSRTDGLALPQLQQKEKQLEYNLEKIRGRNNEQLATIQMMKEQVNAARRERVIASNVFKKLEKDIKLMDEEFKKQILIRMNEEKVKKREEEELKKIKSRSQKELKNFKKEYLNIVRQAEEEFQGSQEQVQNTYDSDINIIEREDPSIMEQQQRNPTRSNTKKMTSMTSIPPATTIVDSLESNQDELEHYKFIFKKLEHETGISDINELVDQYQNIEKENDALYHQANAKNDRIGALQKEIIEVDRQIAERSSVGQERDQIEQDSQNSHQEKKVLTTRLHKIEKNNEALAQQLNELNTKMLEIGGKIGIQAPELGLDEFSADTFLQQIEQKIDDVLNMESYCSKTQVQVEKLIPLDNSQMDKSQVEKQDKEIEDIIDGMKKIKEADKLFSRKNFKSECQEELVQAKGRFAQINNNQQQSKHGKKQKA